MSEDSSEMLLTECLLFHTGAVSCVSSLKYTSMCDGDYTYWPYDQQKCHILLGSWSYTGEEIDFHLEEDGARSLLRLLSMFLLMMIMRNQKSYSEIKS
jgi:hypothetical protein